MEVLRDNVKHHCIYQVLPLIFVAFQYLKDVYKKDGDRLSSTACYKRTRDNGFKLKEGRIRLDIRKNLFYNGSVEIL